MSGQALDFGVEEHRIAGTIIRVFNPVKTVADCLKFRNTGQRHAPNLESL
jgi:hypothetical protein